MKSFIARAAAWLAAGALSGAMACGSTGGCGGTMQNPVNNGIMNQGSSMTCGPGTVQVNTANGPQCVVASAH